MPTRWVVKSYAYLINLTGGTIVFYNIYGGIFMVFKDIDKLLRKNNWYIARIKGSHFQYKHTDISYCVTVPNHGKSDLSINVLKNIEKGTGLSLR